MFRPFHADFVFTVLGTSLSSRSRFFFMARSLRTRDRPMLAPDMEHRCQMWQGFAALFVPSKILAAFSCRPAAPQRTKTFHITSHLSQSVQIKINHHKPKSKHASLSFAPSRLPFLLLKITWSLNTETREECTSQSLKRDRSIRRSRVSEIDFLI